MLLERINQHRLTNQRAELNCVDIFFCCLLWGHKKKWNPSFNNFLFPCRQKRCNWILEWESWLSPTNELELVIFKKKTKAELQFLNWIPISVTEKHGFFKLPTSPFALATAVGVEYGNWGQLILFSFSSPLLWQIKELWKPYFSERLLSLLLANRLTNRLASTCCHELSPGIKVTPCFWLE